MPYFDRFDICEAYYCFAYNWHSGQFSEEYKIFGRLKRMKFKPGIGIYKYKNLTNNSKEIYNNLKERFNCSLIKH